MSRFFHSTFYKNHWVILGISVILFVIGLAFRLYRLDERVAFEGDHTRDLLYAWNIVYYHDPFFAGPFTSGSTLPNAPHFLNFLALLTWICRSNPIAVIYLFAVITTIVVPLLFIWGVVEGAFLSGFIAALLYAVFPGTVGFTDVWEPFFAILPCLIGVIIFRWATKNHSYFCRGVGLCVLCFAGVVHYSFIGLLASVIVYEFLRSRNIRQALIDVSFSAVVLLLFLFPTLIILKENNALYISIRYSGDMCRFCLQKVPLLLQSEFFKLFRPNLLPLYAQQLLYVLAGCISLVGFFIRRKIFTWGLYVSILFLLFAWIFAGQIAFWYLSPFVLFVSYLFGDILAKSLRDRRVYVRVLSVISLSIFICISLCSYRDLYYPASKIQNVIDTEGAVKQTLLSFGVSSNEYIEYLSLIHI